MYSVNLVKEETVYKQLSEEIEEFCLQARSQDAAMSRARDSIVKEIKSLVAGMHPELEVRFCA